MALVWSGIAQSPNVQTTVSNEASSNGNWWASACWRVVVGAGLLVPSSDATVIAVGPRTWSDECDVTTSVNASC